MEERSLRVYEQKTFFSKIGTTISKILIPTKIGKFDIDGFTMLFDAMNAVKEDFNKDLSILGIFITMYRNIGFYRKVIAEVKDEVFIQNDKVIVQRNCASVTLDGSDDENWAYWFNKGQIVPDMLSCVLDNFIEYNKALGTDIRCICDTIIVKSLADIFNEGIALRQTGDTLNRIYVSIKNIYNYPQTVEGFKRYLSQKPLKLVYQLI